MNTILCRSDARAQAQSHISLNTCYANNARTPINPCKLHRILQLERVQREKHIRLFDYIDFGTNHNLSKSDARAQVELKMGQLKRNGSTYHRLLYI